MTSSNPGTPSHSRKLRRRLHRPSSNDEYDRDADRPSPGHSRTWDDDRVVLMDDDEEPLSGLEFWLDQRPPHYGGDV